MISCICNRNDQNCNVIMTNMVTTARDNIIREAIERTLAPGRIGVVRVHEDVDHDGDPIYRITIVLASDDEELEAEKAVRLWEAVIDALQENGFEVRFPIFTFMTPSEAQQDAA